MAWTSLTTSSIQRAMSSAEYDKFVTVLTGSLSTGSILQGVLDDVTQHIRSCIAACPKNELDATQNTIPSGLVYTAIPLLKQALQDRLGGSMVDLDGSTAMRLEKAHERLARIEDCKIAVEQPTTADTESTFGVTPIFMESETPLVY